MTTKAAPAAKRKKRLSLKQIVNAVQFYIAPLIVGEQKAAVAGLNIGSIQIKNADFKKIGNDIRITGDAEYPG